MGEKKAAQCGWETARGSAAGSLDYRRDLAQLNRPPGRDCRRQSDRGGDQLAVKEAYRACGQQRDQRDVQHELAIGFIGPHVDTLGGKVVNFNAS